MRDGYLRGSLARPATQRQMDVLAAFVAAGGSVQDAPSSSLFGRSVRWRLVCYNLPIPPPATARNPGYAAKLGTIAKKVGLRARYAVGIGS